MLKMFIVCGYLLLSFDHRHLESDTTRILVCLSLMVYEYFSRMGEKLDGRVAKKIPSQIVQINNKGCNKCNVFSVRPLSTYTKAVHAYKIAGKSWCVSLCFCMFPLQLCLKVLALFAFSSSLQFRCKHNPRAPLFCR